MDASSYKNECNGVDYIFILDETYIFDKRQNL
jgi:hypothetical protein